MNGLLDSDVAALVALAKPVPPGLQLLCEGVCSLFGITVEVQLKSGRPNADAISLHSSLCSSPFSILSPPFISSLSSLAFSPLSSPRADTTRMQVGPGQDLRARADWHE